MNKPKSPCFNCCKRKARCHINCKEYLEFSSMLKMYTQELYKEQEYRQISRRRKIQ